MRELNRVNQQMEEDGQSMRIAWDEMGSKRKTDEEENREEDRGWTSGMLRQRVARVVMR